jgi:hypothetical protein
MPAPIKGQGRKTYKTMQGKQIDLDLLIKRNELTPAVGNARVNARGDELGPGGRIIRKREEVVKDYYNKNSKPVVTEKVSASPAKLVEDTVSVQEEEMLHQFDEGWAEDEEGNFVKKKVTNVKR